MSLSIDNFTDLAIIVGVSMAGYIAINHVAPKLADYSGAKIDEILDSPRFVGAVHKHVATAPAMIDMAGAVTSLSEAVSKTVQIVNKATKDAK